MLSIHRAREGFPSSGYELVDAWTLRDVGTHMTSSVWCAPAFAGGRRSELHFLGAMWCVLDFDEGATKREMADKFRDYAFVLGPSKSDGIAKTTKSGQTKPACDRFRLVLRFSRPIFDMDVFKYNMKLLVTDCGADLAAIDAARVWQPCLRVDELQPFGKFVDVVGEIPLEETTAFLQLQINDYTVQLKKRGMLPKRVKDFLKGNVALGARNVELYFAACILMQVKGWKVSDVRKMAHDMDNLADMDNIETTIRSAARRVGAAYF